MKETNSPMFRTASPYIFFDNHQAFCKPNDDYYIESPPLYDQSDNPPLNNFVDNDGKYYVDLANLEKNYTIWTKYMGRGVKNFGKRKINNSPIPMAGKFEKSSLNMHINDLEKHLLINGEEVDKSSSNVSFQNELIPIIIIPAKNSAIIPKEVKIEEAMPCSECACSVVGRKLKRSSLFRLIIQSEENLQLGWKLPLTEVSRMVFELSSL
ncbi:uncharacterized protein LOC106666594 [Cimex lectularius]|uniref:Uncharacterized protein n=1 Tax=Cimex lectularius TaxID=79782 RepID=A0A8I6RTG6_CIMLE|nr:uncharacterized protein LOC106666594 [Cimex lectularius]